MAAEVIAPTTATFAAGNTVIGFGTTLPAELAAWAPFSAYPTVKPVTATVFYNSAWSAGATVPTVKFTFMTTVITPDGAVTTFFGFGLVAKPSVSTTAVIFAGFSPAYQANGFGAGKPGAIHRFYSSQNTVLADSREIDVEGDGAFVVSNNAGQDTIDIATNYFNPTYFPGITGWVVTRDASGTPTGTAPAGLG